MIRILFFTNPGSRGQKGTAGPRTQIRNHFVTRTCRSLRPNCKCLVLLRGQGSLSSSNIYTLNINAKAMRIPPLKGQCHEIFDFRLSTWISFPQAPDYTIRVVSNFFENSRRYSQLKMHNRYRWNRWQKEQSSIRKIFIISFGHLCVVELEYI
jgi:hypothetical protein